MVYFTTLAKDAAIESEFKYFNKLIRTFKGVVSFSVFRLDPNSEDFSKIAKKYKCASVV
jgi:hypothetical protein